MFFTLKAPGITASIAFAAGNGLAGGQHRVRRQNVDVVEAQQVLAFVRVGART